MPDNPGVLASLEISTDLSRRDLWSCIRAQAWSSRSREEAGNTCYAPAACGVARDERRGAHRRRRHQDRFAFRSVDLQAK